MTNLAAVSKEIAIDHFHTEVLPRRVHDTYKEARHLEDYGKSKVFYKRTTVGKQGDLYPVLTAGFKIFSHFGKGVGLYFMHLLFLSLLLLFCFIIMSPVLLDYDQNYYGVVGPTAAPIQSQYPSLQPSIQPIHKPSAKPTRQPIYKPSAQPTSMTSAFTVPSPPPSFSSESLYFNSTIMKFLLDKSYQLISVSAACSVITVNATGCSKNNANGNHSTTCTATYRPNCDLPAYGSLADLLISLLFLIVLFLSIIPEKKFIHEMDLLLQSTQDYSVQVSDPSDDAVDPDEWFQFFSKFGKVMYVTVTKKNNKELFQLLKEKHSIQLQIDHFSEEINSSEKPSSMKNLQKLQYKNEKIMTRLNTLCLKSYTASKVYVTFDSAVSKSLCLKELEVPDIDAMTNSSSKVKLRYKFRGENILNMKEPSEPENILWENTLLSIPEQRCRVIISNIIAIALLIAAYFFVTYIFQNSPSYVLIVVITVVDSLFSILFTILTDYTCPRNEDTRQNGLQVKLFCARVLISLILPYQQIGWDRFLDTQYISSIISIQLSACFLSPFLSFLDYVNVIMRHVVGPYTAKTQVDLNRVWSGSDWTIAERYTNIAKLIFISTFYCLLTPVALLFGCIGFILTFFIDRYALLRRWKPIPLMDGKVATLMRQQALLCIFAHMFASLRFIYSWPMDSAYLNPTTNEFVKVHKFPAFDFWNYKIQYWQTNAQTRILIIYKICTIIAFVIILYIWVIEPILRYLHKLFFSISYERDDGEGIPFSSLQDISVYIPTVLINGEKFMCASLIDVLPTNKPFMIRCYNNDIDNLSAYIPVKHQPHILPVVKYYGSKDIEIVFDDSNSSRDNSKKSIIKNNVGEEYLYSDYHLVETNEGVIEKIPDRLPNELRDKLKVSDKVRITSSSRKLSRYSSDRFTEPKKIPSYREPNSILMERELY